MTPSAPVAPLAPFVILAALDRKMASAEVLATAVSLAARTPGAVLHLLHIVERLIGVEAAALELYQQELAAGCRYLDETASSVGARSELSVVTDAPGDAVADAILRKAASLDADLVLVGTSDPKPLARWLLGSVAEEVMRKAGCAVLVVRPKHHDATGVPVIEAPCAACAAAYQATHEPEARCAQHAHPLRQHLHYEMPQGYGAGSMFVRP
jgi:nucleotide-binding universal stress UspA family protein